MTNTVVVTQVNNSVLVTEQVNDVIISSVGVQGPAGATGATGATGSSGVIAVTAPITNSGTSTSANIGVDLSNIALKYASSWQTKYRSTYWYDAKNGATLTTGSFNQQNRLFAYPVFIQESITLDRIATECVTTAVASTTVRMGIYSADADGLPSTLVLDAGTVSTATTGLKAITISQTLSAGLYFFAYVWQGGASSPTMRVTSRQGGLWTPVASTTQQSDGYATQYYVDNITGALSTFGTPTVVSGNPIRIQYRVA